MFRIPSSLWPVYHSEVVWDSNHYTVLRITICHKLGNTWPLLTGQVRWPETSQMVIRGSGATDSIARKFTNKQIHIVKFGDHLTTK